MKHITQTHQRKHFPISRNQLHEQFGMERRENLPYHGLRTFESCIAEEYPAEANEMESKNHRKEFPDACTAVGLRTMQQAAQELMDSQCRTVQSAPKDEVPQG